MSKWIIKHKDFTIGEINTNENLLDIGGEFFVFYNWIDEEDYMMFYNTVLLFVEKLGIERAAAKLGLSVGIMTYFNMVISYMKQTFHTSDIKKIVIDRIISAPDYLPEDVN